MTRWAAVLVLLAAGCTDTPVGIIDAPVDVELVAISEHPDTSCVDDYPFHIHWLAEPAWEPLKAAVEAAARKWAHIVAPTPRAAYVYQTAITCNPVGGTGTLAFAVGDTLAAGLHLYIDAGDYSGIAPPLAVAFDCTPNWSRMGPDSLYQRPHNTQYNPVGNTPPAGVITFPAQVWANEGQRDRYWLTPRRAYITALHEIGHVMGIGSGETWWDAVEVRRDVYDMGGTYGTWRASILPGAYWTDSLAVNALGAVLEEQGIPYGGDMIPLSVKWVGLTARGDTVYEYPYHWDDCLQGTAWHTNDRTGRVTRFGPTGELMRPSLDEMVDPRITATTLAALQGFTARPYSADYMAYGYDIRQFCRRQQPAAVAAGDAPPLIMELARPAPAGVIVEPLPTRR